MSPAATNDRVARLLARAGITLNGPAPYDPQIRDARVFRRVLVWGSLGLGDAYADGMWDCEQLDVFFDKTLSAHLEQDIVRFGDWVLALRDKLVNLQSVRRVLHVAEYHYDLGNRMYEHMLGESMGYSSGYYRGGAAGLTEAQYAKFDLVCRKLDIRPGMRVLEIGSGWGTFARHCAQKYGAHLLSVTVSKEQLAYARERCKGLPADFHFGDYRTLSDQYQGTFDRAVSIEMIEAVGARNIRSYMEVAHRMLAKDGAFLIQAILGTGAPDVWLSTRIFPNGVLPSMRQLVDAMDGLFRISHVENFGLDYDKTLCAWERNFREQWPEIKAITGSSGAPLYDERFYRMWRYYLLVCAGAFRSRKIDVAHIIFSKPALF